MNFKRGKEEMIGRTREKNPTVGLLSKGAQGRFFPTYSVQLGTDNEQ